MTADTPAAPASADAPDRIYLQVCDDDTCVEPFSAHHEVTWCEDQIDEQDVEYLRADRQSALLAEKDAEIERLRAALSRETNAHAELQARCFDYGGTGQNVFDDIRAATERAEKAEQDARRYRFVRSAKYADVIAWWLLSAEAAEVAATAVDLDAVIDAALAEQEGK